MRFSEDAVRRLRTVATDREMLLRMFLALRVTAFSIRRGGTTVLSQSLFFGSRKLSSCTRGLRDLREHSITKIRCNSSQQALKNPMQMRSARPVYSAFGIPINSRSVSFASPCVERAPWQVVVVAAGLRARAVRPTTSRSAAQP